jgi:hypothetical protein
MKSRTNKRKRSSWPRIHTRKRPSGQPVWVIEESACPDGSNLGEPLLRVWGRRGPLRSGGITVPELAHFPRTRPQRLTLKRPTQRCERCHYATEDIVVDSLT